jgi:TfoX/Sxy family transcriptional regulator of competence genes
MKIPKPSEKSAAFFKSIVPDDYRVSIRPMFGNLSAFVNGNMFMGVYGEEIFVRLAQEDQPELLDEKGSSFFAPLPGRTMKEYIVLPHSFREKPEKIEEWVNRSLEWSLTLPPKAKKKQQTRSGSKAKRK